MMTEEEKLKALQALAAMGCSIGQLNMGDGYQNCAFGTARPRQEVAAEEAEVVAESAEEAVRQAIEELLAAKDEAGEYVMRHRTQWYGVYRILADCGAVESNAYTAFGEYVERLGVDDARLPHLGKDLRKYSAGTLGERFERWDMAEVERSAQSRRIYAAASKFKEILEKRLP